jgi:flagellar assembly factor FliW
MKVNTTRFGTVEVDDGAEITFTQPILGFQEYRRFILLPGPENSPLKWLQSTESGELAFIVMDPRAAVPDYEIRIGSQEMAELAVDSIEELEVYTLVVVPQDRTQIRTNLKAPVLVNPRQRLAKQTILDRSKYPIQFYLAQAQGGDRESAQEVKHARSNA